MALTQISTAGVKDDIVTAAKIADDAVTEALISDDSVDEARLKISNAGSNGQFLQKQSGNTGGLTWADASVGGNTGTDYNDNIKVRFGTDNDLEIYHSGGINYITSPTDKTIRITAKTGEDGVKVVADDTVELYHNNVKKLETTSSGVIITGNAIATSKFRGNDDVKLSLGDGEDLQVYHNGQHSYIKHSQGSGNFFIDSAANIALRTATDETSINCGANGAVELYYDNAKTFETINGGATVTGQLYVTAELNLINGSNNAHRYIDAGLGDGNTLTIRGTSGGDANHETLATFTRNGASELYYDNSKKFETYAGGCQMGGDLSFYDNQVANFGTGSDLQIKHDGTNNLIVSTGANNWIQTSGTQGFANGSEYEIKCYGNGGVELFYDNSVKLETTSWGTKSTGRLEAVSDGSSTSYSSPSAFLAYSSNSADEDAAEIFQGRYNRRCLTCSNAYDGSITQIAFESNDATCGTITCTNANATQYNTSSDYRLKENEVAISDGISRLKTLKPYRFNFKNKKDITVDGFFAHEVTAVPEAITGEKDGAEMQQIDQSKLVPLLVASLQEAIAKIETLETEVAALKG